jgi:hypothetical protein
MLPRRLATEEAGSMESAVMKLVMKNRVPSLLSEILNLSWKKNVIQELQNISWEVSCGMEKETNSGARELANESSANRMHNLMTVILLLRLKVTDFQNGKVFFFGDESSVSDSSDGVSKSVVNSGGVFSISQFLLRPKMKQSIIPPSAEYAQKTALYALMVSHPNPLMRKLTNTPQTPKPVADPSAPSNEYQAYISPRFSLGVIWAIVDSSIARKGPISLPLGIYISKKLKGPWM